MTGQGQEALPTEIMTKIKTFREIAEICKDIRKEGKTIVFTNGCFDILHTGHIRMLRRAALQGDVLIVGLNTDESVKRIKGGSRPFVKEKDRAEILSALEMVDYVVLFPQDTPEKLLSVIKPDVLVKGGDYKIDQVVGRKFVEYYGGRVVVVPEVKGRSTTDLVTKIRTLC